MKQHKIRTASIITPHYKTFLDIQSMYLYETVGNIRDNLGNIWLRDVKVVGMESTLCETSNMRHITFSYIQMLPEEEDAS